MRVEISPTAVIISFATWSAVYSVIQRVLSSEVMNLAYRTKSTKNSFSFSAFVLSFQRPVIGCHFNDRAAAISFFLQLNYVNSTYFNMFTPFLIPLCSVSARMYFSHIQRADISIPCSGVIRTHLLCIQEISATKSSLIFYLALSNAFCRDAFFCCFLLSFCSSVSFLEGEVFVFEVLSLSYSFLSVLHILKFSELMGI